MSNATFPPLEEEPEYDPFSFEGATISKETHRWLTVVIKTIFSGGFALLGMCTNTMNVILFYKQGPMSNSAMVALTGLAVSDFWVCCFGVWKAVLGVLYSLYDTSKWSWTVRLFSAFTGARPLNLTTQITCWITTFVAFERAMSVMLPFKVKIIFTPKRSLICVISISVIICIISAPDLLEYYITEKIWPETNLTQVTWLRNEAVPISVKEFFYYLNPVFLRFLSIFLVIVCNIVIFWKVNLSQRFRKSKAHAVPTTQPADFREKKSHAMSSPSPDSKEDKSGECSSPENDQEKTKEMKLLRMITVISVTFTFCYILNIIQVILYRLILEFPGDFHWSEQNLVWDAAMFFQILNSSINFFIYLNMSSRFRNDLKTCCSRNRT